MKTISMLCVLLACVTPALAADYVMFDAAGVYSEANIGLWRTIEYLGDSPAYQTWANTYYTSTFGASGVDTYSPSYSDFLNSPATQLPGAGDTVRFQQVSQTMTINATSPAAIQWDKCYMGDAYYPVNYSASGTVTQGYVSQSGARAVSMNTLTFGRNPLELPNTQSLASFATWKIQSGSLSMNNLNVTNDNFVHSYYNTTTDLGYTTVKIGTDNSGTNNSQVINIGDISLNETRLMLHANAGTWNITGDISYGGDVAGSKGNLALILVAPYNPGGVAAGATINMQRDELMQLIDDGQFFVRSVKITGVSFTLNECLNIGLATKDFESYISASNTIITGGAFAGQHILRAVTRDSMYKELQIVDLGNGMVKVNMIPEPATLALLGLGAVLSFRRKR